MALTKVTGDFIKAGSITQGHLHSSHGITTSHITEGDKLFFTNARVDSRVGSLSTSDLSEGTNLYYTDARADARVALIVDSAPGTLNTLNELAAALGDDANFSTTVTNSIALKAPLASPSFTGNATFAGEVNVPSGKISILGGNNLTISGTAANHAGLSFGTNIIYPATAAGTNDNTFDLGDPDERFKDLYLGGSITAGGGGTFAGDVKLADNKKLILGLPGNDLQIYHDGGNSKITDAGTGNLFIGTDLLGIESSNHGETMAKFYADGPVKLYYDNIQKFQTTSAGIEVSGSITASGGTLTGALQAQPWLFRSMASQTEYHVLDNGSLNGPSWKFRYDGATANRYVDFGYKDGNGNYTSGLKLYNNQTISWRGTDIINASAQWTGGIASSGYNNSNWDTAYGWGNHASAGYAPAGGSYGTDWYVDDLYHDEWIRNHTNNNGHYWSSTGWHLYPRNSEFFYLRSGLSTSTGLAMVCNNETIRGYVYADSGSNIGLLNNAGQWSLQCDNSKNVTAHGSSRAPLFYDSNDTSYFLNPSASGGNALKTIGDWRQTTDSWSGEVGGKMQYHGNHWYLQATGYVHFRNASGTNTFYVDQNGVGYVHEYIAGGSSLRAPLFYDSANTNYYVDPAGTSRLYHAQTTNGSEFIHCKHSGSDFANGTLVTTDIPANTTSGASYVIEVTGKSYSGEPPFAFKAQGYLYNDTIINHSGVSYGRHLTSTNQIKVFNHSDNKLAFWWPRVSYWNSFEVRVRDAGGSSRNRALTVVNSTEPSSSKKVTTTLSQAALLGHNFGSGSLYSDRLYDSNDTSYYVDANSQSILKKIWINNGGAGGVGWSSGLNMGDGSNYWNMIQDGGIARQRNFGPNGYDWYSNGGSQLMDLSNTGNLLVSGDMRAPIFYDSNDTTYYVDPAALSNVVNIALKGDIRFPTSSGGTHSRGSRSYAIYQESGSWSSPFPDLNIGFHTGISIGAYGGYGGTRFFNNSDMATQIMSVGNVSDGLGADNVYINNKLQVGTDVRTPIFYDVNNTNYYIDPDSTGLSAKLRSYLLFNDFGAGIVGSYSSYRYQLVFAMGDSYKGALDGTNVSGGYGLWYSHPNAGGVAANLSNHGLMNIANGTWHASLASSTRASVDMRAPYFYDLDNTAYFSNPGGTGYYNKIWCRGSATNSAPRWDTSFHVLQSQHLYAHSSTQTMYIGENNTINIRSTGVASSSLRAPIFYDTANTTYYTRPASSSLISSLYTHGLIQAGQSGSGDIYIGGTSGNYLRFHLNNSHQYFDMNCGDIHWRQGSSTRFIFYMTTANMTVNGSVTQNSDERIKENIITIDSALDKVNKLRGVYYNRKDINTSQKQIGFIAQEVETVIPEVVLTANDELKTKSISYGQINALLVEAIKEQQTIIDNLKSRLETLENQ